MSITILDGWASRERCLSILCAPHKLLTWIRFAEISPPVSAIPPCTENDSTMTGCVLPKWMVELPMQKPFQLTSLLWRSTREHVSAYVSIWLAFLLHVPIILYAKRKRGYLLRWMAIKGILRFQPPVDKSEYRMIVSCVHIMFVWAREHWLNKPVGNFEVHICVIWCVALCTNGRLQWQNGRRKRDFFVISKGEQRKKMREDEKRELLLLLTKKIQSQAKEKVSWVLWNQ